MVVEEEAVTAVELDEQHTPDQDAVTLTVGSGGGFATGGSQGDSFTTTNATSRWKDEAQVMRNPPTAMHDAVPPLIPPPCMTRHPSQCDAISSADLGGRR